MKVERHTDKELLTRIRRSYWNVPAYKKREGIVRTRLFVFEHLDCGNFEFHWSMTTCVKVTVVSTGENYVMTHGTSFGKTVGDLWRVIE